MNANETKDTTAGTHVIVGEGTVEVGQHVWRESRSSFPMCHAGGTYKTKLDDGREVEGSYAFGLGGDLVVDVKWTSAHGNGAQFSTFTVSAQSAIALVLSLIEQGKVEERAPGATSSAVPSRTPDVEQAHVEAMRENRLRWKSRDRVLDVDAAHDAALVTEHLVEEGFISPLDAMYSRGTREEMADWEPFCEYCGDNGCVHCAEDAEDSTDFVETREGGVK